MEIACKGVTRHLRKRSKITAANVEQRSRPGSVYPAVIGILYGNFIGNPRTKCYLL